MNLLNNRMECMQVWFHDFVSSREYQDHSSPLSLKEYSFVTSGKFGFQKQSSKSSTNFSDDRNCRHLDLAFEIPVFVKPRWTTKYSGSERECSAEING